MRIALIAVSLVAAFGARSASASARYAVMGKGALYRAPNASAPRAGVRDRLLLRVVARRGAWVEVRVARRQHHCGVSTSARLGLRWFVRVQDLVPVARRQVSADLGDETGVFTLEGAPLWLPVQRHVVKARDRRYRFEAGLPRIVPRGRGLRAALTRRAALSVGTHRIPLATGTAVRILKRRRDRVLVAVRRPCWGVRGWVEHTATQVERPGPATGEMVGAVGAPPARSPGLKWLRSRSRVYWPDGRRAGRSYEAIALTGPITRRGRLRCARLAPARQVSAVELCFAAARVSRRRR